MECWLLFCLLWGPLSLLLDIINGFGLVALVEIAVLIFVLFLFLLVLNKLSFNASPVGKAKAFVCIVELLVADDDMN